MDIRGSYERHLIDEKQMRPRSVRDYMLVADEFLKRFDCQNGVSFADVNNVLIELKDKLSWSAGTVYKYAVCSRHFWRWMHSRGYRPDNPYSFSDWKKPRPTTPKFLTTELFMAVQDDPLLSHQEMTLLWLLWDSAGRIGEISALTQSNIDLVKKIVNIPYEISKGNYSYRNVPISDKCNDLLLKQFAYVRKRGHSLHIFINANNEPMTTSGLQKVVASIGLRKSPLRPTMRLACHMFRHSAGIRWLEQEVPQLIVQKWLGHQTLQMTSAYISVDSQSGRRIFERYCQPKMEVLCRTTSGNEDGMR